ncbi:hypothetical protein VTO42DRAFT_3354 [Malbranchea cinnamomea]
MLGCSVDTMTFSWRCRLPAMDCRITPLTGDSRGDTYSRTARWNIACPGRRTAPAAAVGVIRQRPPP